MIHLVTFSGGKDSGALICWAKETLGTPGVDWIPVFCNTRWEHPITYAYLDEVNASFLGGTLRYLESTKFPGGFLELIDDRKMIPTMGARFCTTELKTEPIHQLIQSLDDEVTVYQGIRADESNRRALLPPSQWVDDAGGYQVERPLLHWTAEQCFEQMRRFGLDPNPLYKLGAKRVGCFPCIFIGRRELRNYLLQFPEIKPRLISLERRLVELVGADEWAKSPRTFFRTDYIPARFCSITWSAKCSECEGSGRVELPEATADVDLLFSESVQKEIACPKCGGSGSRTFHIPTAEDVFRYLESVDEDQLPIDAPRSCFSVYNLCE